MYILTGGLNACIQASMKHMISLRRLNVADFDQHYVDALPVEKMLIRELWQVVCRSYYQ